MTAIVLAVILALQAAAPSIPINPLAGPHQESTTTYAVSSGATLAVATASGRISVEAGEPGKIIVVVTRSASTQQGVAALSAEVNQNGNNVAAMARFPKPCDDCGNVSFQIQVPPDTNVVAHSDAGSVNVNDVAGAVTASTVRGPVLCGGLSGNATLGAQEGMVNGGFRDLSHVTKVTIGTSSGTVRLVLPASASVAELLARTGDGAIHSQLPLNVVPKGTGAVVDQRFGANGPKIVIGTDKGDVDIVKAP